ncbi:hypothetical protein AB0C59_17960 [Streptomyces sp. NPDC048664]|uniref:hypothetical protein n=1 Tax=Streptomyces sp. NPDC048664 TaxID=3154505 RepID=UPI00341B71B0
MTDRRHRDPGRKKGPIPRDMPDQQAGGGDERRRGEGDRGTEPTEPVARAEPEEPSD